MELFTTHLVFEECIPDIFRHARHGQNVILTSLVSLNVDTIAEHNAVISDQLESARRELARSWVNPGHILEQLCPSLLLVGTPEYTIIVLLRAQLVQSYHNGIHLIFHRWGSLFEYQLVPQ